MAEWDQRALALPKEFDDISRNAQNAINSVDTVLSIVKQAGNVAKLFLMLANPAGTIIRLAANEIIQLCNDFKEIGVFYILINPMDKQYGNLNPATYGLKIKQDQDGNYLFEPAIQNTGGLQIVHTVDANYQKTLQLSELVSYRDNLGVAVSDGGTPPTPIFDDPPQYELGGYDPATWTGELPTVPKLANGVFPPQMTPSQVLNIMSEAFDDEGDVSIFEIKKTEQKKQFKELFTASGAAVDMSIFNINLPQTERIFKLPSKGEKNLEEVPLELSDREEITTLISSGKPNFSGSSNIQGIETLAIIGLVAVADFQAFVTAFQNLNKLFGGAPEMGELVKELEAIQFTATEEGKEKLTLTNNTRYGAWEEGDYIIGEKSGAVGQISKVVKVANVTRTRTDTEVIYDEDAVPVRSVPRQKNTDPNGYWKRVDVLYKKNGTVNFQAGELVFEATSVPDKETQRNLFAGNLDEPRTFNVVKKAYGPSLTNPEVPMEEVDPADVPKYGEILGVDTSAPESVHPNFTSIKIKDMIPGYAGFFDEIIQFAEGLKSFADGADTYIKVLLKMIDKYIKYFKEIADKIKAFLKLFADGLPATGIYWLAIRTYGGNKAIQKALTESDNAPSDKLKFCAGFMMVSVSGMGGLSATTGLEALFGGMGLRFQEVAPIPEESELDTTLLQLQSQYNAATAAANELAEDVQDVLGLNPPELYRNATTITLQDWNGTPPEIGDYVLGIKSGALGQILAFSPQIGAKAVIVLDHIKTGPTLTSVTVNEERIVRIFDVESKEFLQFPYDGSVATTDSLVFSRQRNDPIVGEGMYLESVLTQRSSHSTNELGTTVYEVFQGNRNTFVAENDREEQVTNLTIPFALKADEPWNTFGIDRPAEQQVFRIVEGSVKAPELSSGHNGLYGHFTDDDTIISFNEGRAQTFLADIEGRNTEADRITRLEPPPTLELSYENKMVATVAGVTSISVTGDSGIVGSYAEALNNIKDERNLPEDNDQ